MDLATRVSSNFDLVREKSPLVLCITNFVAMEFSANVLLAIGASPIMSQQVEDVTELAQKCDAIVINMGTLGADWQACAEIAWKVGRQRGIPVVFDPVGVGASEYRTNWASHWLAEIGATVVRGNGSEVLALLGAESTSKGVDSTVDSKSVVERAKTEAQKSKTVFTISGAEDFIAGPTQSYRCANGHPSMTSVTGMGCVATCIVAAFCAVESDSALASLGAMAIGGLCGELGFDASMGPGSLRTSFLDNLSRRDLPIEKLKVCEL